MLGYRLWVAHLIGFVLQNLLALLFVVALLLSRRLEGRHRPGRRAVPIVGYCCSPLASQGCGPGLFTSSFPLRPAKTHWMGSEPVSHRVRLACIAFLARTWGFKGGGRECRLHLPARRRR